MRQILRQQSVTQALPSLLSLKRKLFCCHSWRALSITDVPWGTSARGLLCSITAERQTGDAASWRLENLQLWLPMLTCVPEISLFWVFFQNVFSSFYWSSVFFKLFVHCQLFLFFLWLLLSAAYLHLGKKGHAKCIEPHSFHVASCNSNTLWFEPIHPASAQAGFHWGSVYGFYSEHNAEHSSSTAQQSSCLALSKCSATIWLYR